MNLRGGERVSIAVPFTDFGGRSVFHCHNADHEDGGMMAVIDVSGEHGGAAATPAPSTPSHDHH